MPDNRASFKVDCLHGSILFRRYGLDLHDDVYRHLHLTQFAGGSGIVRNTNVTANHDGLKESTLSSQRDSKCLMSCYISHYAVGKQIISRIDIMRSRRARRGEQFRKVDDC